MTPPEAAALLAGTAFADRLAHGAPLIVAGGEPLRVAFATRAALTLFGVDTIEALEAIALGAESPGARRLRQLAETLPAGKPARLESLRFYAARRPLPIGLMCARVASADWRDFLVMATQPGAGEATAAVVAPSEIAPPVVAEPAREVTVKPAADALVSRRFLWSLDADGRFGAPDAALQSTVGAQVPNAHERLDDFAARVALDAGGALTAAIDARRTFSALRLAWPDVSGAVARVALISGAPIFDKGRRFSGFRGFGLFTDETVAVAPIETVPPATEEPAQSVDAVPAQAEALPPVDAASFAEPASPPLFGEAPPSSAEPPAASDPEPPKATLPSPERNAEIVVLRPAAPLQSSPNVIPIRPGTLTGLPLPAEEPRRASDGREPVELTNDERDAFREIARALGARLPPREERPAVPEPTTARGLDLVDRAAAPQEPAPPPTPEPYRNASELLDHLPIGAMVLRAGEPLYFNRTMLDLAGYGDLAELRAADGMAHMFRGRDAQTIAEESAGGAMPLVTADGEFVPVDAHVQPIVWNDAPATLIALRRARSAESEAELRALEREARMHEAAARDLEAALETATDGVIGLDASGHIVSMSRAARTLFGYEMNEVADQSFLMLFAPQSQSEATARLEQMVQNDAQRAAVGEDLVGRDRRGQAIDLTLTIARCAAPSSAARYCALIRDRSPERAAERKLEAARDVAEQASSRKTDFLARISHEVRTPLHAILGFAEVMIEERFGSIGNDRYKDYLKDIHASAKHVMSLANDLLDLSKIEAGKMELEFAPVDANRIVRECVSLMQPQAAQEHIIVRLSLFDKLPNVMADERSLRQILLNLMSNAVKFNEPGGQVIVSTALDEAGHPVIRVRDTGAGMDEGELVTALEPFRQIGGAHRAGGSGLGLPLTKALAEANHAGFSIKSRKEQGTLVEVAFPTTQAAQ